MPNTRSITAPISERIRSVIGFERGLVRSCFITVDRLVGPLVDNVPGAERLLAHVRGAADDVAEHRPAASRFTDEQDPADEQDAEEQGAEEQDAADGPTGEGPIDGGPTDGGPIDGGPTDGGTVELADEPVDEGSAELGDAEVEEAEELAEEYLEAEEGHLTGELADNDELRRVQAELRAKHTLQEVDEREHD